MTDKNNQTEMTQFIGWVIALDPIISLIINTFIPIDILFCFWDRERLRKQNIWKHKQIAWGWCLLSPVYLYKRTKLLNESMLKFRIWIYVFAVLCIYGAIVFKKSMLEVNKCTYNLMQYGVPKATALEVCFCSIEDGKNERICLKEHGLIE